MNNIRFQYIIIAIVALAACMYFYSSYQKSGVNNPAVTPSVTPSVSLFISPTPIPSSTPTKQTEIAEPIDGARDRVTKKPFGIKISPQNSPVSPERFSGYHAGMDFETFPDEQNIDVSVFAICTGPLVLKKFASGYGGVAVQLCQIENQDVTVVYGHLRLSSIAAKTSQIINAGSQIGVLGTGYGTETDKERKHLHLGIHKGKNIALLGYVQTPKELDQWIDAIALLK